MSIAPIAAVILAVGAGGAGLALGRADLAAAGAAAGAAGVIAEQASSRSTRRRLRGERGQMRGQIRDLESRIAQLERDIATAPSVLPAAPQPPHLNSGPLPLVGAKHRPVGPITPTSLPILTANRRGLQSCASEPTQQIPTVTVQSALEQARTRSSAPQPGRRIAPPVAPERVLPAGLPILPGQRPPATPITGLQLPPVEDPALPKLSPGPAAPVLYSAGVPRLSPGPSQHVATRAHGEATPAAGLDLALIGAQSAATAGATEQPVAQSLAPLTVQSSSDRVSTTRSSADVPFEIIDLRTLPTPAPLTRRGERMARQAEAMVFADIAESDRSELDVLLERPGRHAASLFEPAGGDREIDPVDEAEMRRLADAARQASRALRPSSMPPSPFFTPGAFEREATAQRDSA